MLTVRMIWIQGSDGFIWLADAWESDTISENPQGWSAAITKASKDALANGGAYRVQTVKVPGVHDLFNDLEVTAEAPAERLQLLLSNAVDAAREASLSREDKDLMVSYLRQIGRETL